MGKSEATAGLTFVYLSRTKQFVDLLAESMPFDGKIKLLLRLDLKRKYALKRLQFKNLYDTGCDLIS